MSSYCNMLMTANSKFAILRANINLNFVKKICKIKVYNQ